MTDLIQNIVNILTPDVTLAGLMNTSAPIKSIYTGPVDVVKEAQSTLGMPLITIMAVSESFRTVPQGARDSRIALSIVSRNSELEVENIYERVAALLNFTMGNINASWLAWERGDSLVSQYQGAPGSDLWSWTFDIRLWSI